MSCVTLVKAGLARFLFGAHTLVTVWRVVSQEEDAYWKLAIGILVLFLEGLHAVCFRRGEELRYFCPSIFIYLATIVPAIWILELKTDRRETLCTYVEAVRDSRMGQDPDHDFKRTLLLELMQMKQSDIDEASEACLKVSNAGSVPYSGKKVTSLRRRLDSMAAAAGREEGLKRILDIEVKIQLRPEQWTRILEQVVLVVLILGRWLLPKGQLSRDQFSQLMLVYIGMAADIVEIFEAFREAKVMLEPGLTYAVLGVWSWSLVQFCLVLGSSGRKSRLLAASQLDNVVSSHQGGQGPPHGKSKAKKMDMMVIVASLVMQDLPFFCLRMVLIFRFRVISHMNIFFTCKNTLVILLQLYRLLVLVLEKRPLQRLAHQESLWDLPPDLTPESSSQSSVPPAETINLFADEDSGPDDDCSELQVSSSTGGSCSEAFTIVASSAEYGEAAETLTKLDLGSYAKDIAKKITQTVV